MATEIKHESRQRRRWYERVIAELTLSNSYNEKRKQGARDLLARQSFREKEGFYVGTTSVASARGAVGRPTRRVLKDDTTTKRRPNNLVQLW
jgi:hypothetical protein